MLCGQTVDRVLFEILVVAEIKEGTCLYHRVMFVTQTALTSEKFLEDEAAAPFATTGWACAASFTHWASDGARLTGRETGVGEPSIQKVALRLPFLVQT